MADKVITVFEKPACVQCTATKRWLDENGFKDQYGIEDSIDHLDGLKDTVGYLQAPVVKVLDKKTGETVFWSGFNRDLLIKNLAA